MATTQSPTPPCDHTYLSQTLYGKLPPLYFSTTTFTSRSITLLEKAYAHLEARYHTRSPIEAREIEILRRELEAGMSRDRREQTQYYVLQIQDLRKRKAMEVYQARYPGFMMYGNARLDDGFPDGGGEDIEGGVWETVKEKVAGCKVM